MLWHEQQQSAATTNKRSASEWTETLLRGRFEMGPLGLGSFLLTLGYYFILNCCAWCGVCGVVIDDGCWYYLAGCSSKIRSQKQTVRTSYNTKYQVR